MPPRQGDVLICAGALQRFAKAARLPVTAPAALQPGIAADIAGALTRYAAARAPATHQPTLAGTVKHAHMVAEHADALLKLLDADCRGPDGSLPPFVPVPGWLIADPARRVPGIDTAIALDSGEARGDRARDAMLAEAGMHLDASSIFGAHDVARVAVAALRQLASMADTAARHTKMVRRTRYDPVAPKLFGELAETFEALHGRRYTVNNERRTAGRESMPGGRAMRWTLELFKCARDVASAAGMPCAQALCALADYYQGHPDALAGRIRATREAVKRRQSYSRLRRAVKNPVSP